MMVLKSPADAADYYVEGGYDDLRGKLKPSPARKQPSLQTLEADTEDFSRRLNAQPHLVLAVRRKADGGGVLLKIREEVVDEDAEKQKSRKLIDDHNGLAEVMHNLLEISLAPSVLVILRNIPTKYNSIIRLWLPPSGEEKTCACASRPVCGRRRADGRCGSSLRTTAFASTSVTQYALCCSQGVQDVAQKTTEAKSPSAAASYFFSANTKTITTTTTTEIAQVATISTQRRSSQPPSALTRTQSQRPCPVPTRVRQALTLTQPPVSTHAGQSPRTLASPA
ncbi:hypothetical protein FIBSPDRAFT_887979 [Athelia psychrophila]|uniref:Uncharacterized protein n=1 Tax=Athelia psychrophila TaxID=1759441 RepID=A0A166P6B2_9AGAM|nr:hypothetical protein FIBSPDRAFT_887979 [Fibularhizoctonia sp. CBS 109695]